MAQKKSRLHFDAVIDGFKDRLGSRVNETLVNVFVCGPNIRKLPNGGGRSKGSAIRHFVSKELERNNCIYVWGEHRKFRSAIPTTLRRFFSDADNEVAFARDSDVDLILIFPASPGSIAELGVFALDEDIASKMMIILDDELRSSKGFVVGGIIKSAKKRKAQVNFKDYRNRSAIWALVENRIKTLQSIKVTKNYGTT